MNETIEIQAKLVHWGPEGTDLEPVKLLDARVCEDHEHGDVLEITLPESEHDLGSKVVFVPVTEIRKLIAAKAI